MVSTLISRILKAVPFVLVIFMALEPSYGASLRARIGNIGGVTVTKEVESLKDIKEKNIIIQKYDHSCGSAALATILKSQFEETVEEEKIIKEMLKRGDVKKIIERKGFSLLDLKMYAESRGYEAKGYRMTFEELVEFQSPVIVPVVINDYRHFVIFKGVREDRVFLADPSLGNSTMPISQFKKVWYSFENVGLVIDKQLEELKGRGKLLDISEADEIYISSPSFKPALRSQPFLFTHDPLSW